MQAAVTYAANQPIEVVDIELGELGPYDIQVEIKFSGLCHSDVSAQKGLTRFPSPLILGHEGAGIVTATGSNVSQTQVGSHIVLSALIHCGVCDHCKKGKENICLWGLASLSASRNSNSTRGPTDSKGTELFQFASIGTLATHLICSEKHAVNIPKDVPLDIACLAGCAVLTGTGAVFNRAKVSPGSTVLVIGCGGVGLNVIQASVIAGASTIIGVDLHDSKLEMARSFGATHIINSASKTSVVDQVKHITQDIGIDFAFEVVGVAETLRLGWDCLAIDGTLTAVGMHAMGSEFSLPADEMNTEKTLMASLYGSNRPTSDIARVIEQYREGKLKLEDLITERFELKDINLAVDKLLSGEGARSIVVFD